MKIDRHMWNIKYFVCGLILIGSIANAMVSSANTFYVSTTGNDAVSCATAENINTPKRTIAAGVGCITTPGSTLYIRAGTYVENAINISAQCTAQSPCTVSGYPGDARPLLKPPAPPAFTGIAGAISVGGGSNSYVTIKNIDMDMINLDENKICIGVYAQHVTLENIYCVNAPRNGFYLVGPPNPSGISDYAIVRNNHIKNCGRIQPSGEYDTKGLGIYSVSANSLIENNLIDGCRAGGIEINYEGNFNSIFRNNIIRNAGTASPWGPISSTYEGGSGRPTTGRGINIGGTNPQNNKIYNNIIYNIRGTGSPSERGRCFAFWGSSGQPTANLIANNTCHNADAPYTTVSCNVGNHNAIMQNNIFADTLNAACGLTGTIGNNLTNPSVSATFVNAPAGDFHLKSSGPAINTGMTIATVTNDYNRVARPQGGAYDIGAFEHVGQPSGQLSPPKKFRVTSK